MIKKFFIWAWSMRKQFAQYFVVGISGTVLDMGTLYLFKEYFHLRPVIAVLVNQAIILCYIFLLNKFWVFRAHAQTRRQVIRFLEVYIFNYIVAIVWIFGWSEYLGYNYLWTRLANIALSVSWNFLFYKFWVYRVEQPKMAKISQINELQ